MSLRIGNSRNCFLSTRQFALESLEILEFLKFVRRRARLPTRQARSPTLCHQVSSCLCLWSSFQKIDFLNRDALPPEKSLRRLAYRRRAAVTAFWRLGHFIYRHEYKSRTPFVDGTSGGTPDKSKGKSEKRARSVGDRLRIRRSDEIGMRVGRGRSCLQMPGG
jgi:hypothetical protein